MIVYLLWRVDEDNHYPIDSEVVAIFSTREAAEKAREEAPKEYHKSYAVQERAVLE